MKNWHITKEYEKMSEYEECYNIHIIKILYKYYFSYCCFNIWHMNQNTYNSLKNDYYQFDEQNKTAV